MAYDTRLSSREPSKRLVSELEQGRKIADDAEAVWGYGSPAGILRADRRAVLHIKYGQINSSSYVLEVGCGTGGITRRVAPTGARIMATDLTLELITRARRVASFSNVIFQVANAEELPFGSEEFDVVFGNAILHHLNFIKALDEFRRVLKSGGRIVFTEPNMLNPQIALQKNWGWLKEKLSDTPEESAFLAWQVRRLLRAQGYTDVFVCPFDFLHPAIPKAFTMSVQKLGNFLEKVPLLRQIAGSLLIVGSKA